MVAAYTSFTIERYRPAQDELLELVAEHVTPWTLPPIQGPAAPQAADELLSIDGVDGSFVLYENEGVIYISARSMGAINVQMIMETLGGGGHHTMAATQIRGIEMEKARQMLLEAIDKYYESHPLN